MDALKYKNFCISINDCCGTKFPLAPDQKGLDYGVAEFDLPATTNYMICIANFTDVFTIDGCSIGEDEVKINNGADIYYKGSAFIKGLETGTESNFVFTASKAGLEQEADAKKGSNLIKLKLSTWNRHVKPVVHSKGKVSKGKVSKGKVSNGKERGGSLSSIPFNTPDVYDDYSEYNIFDEHVYRSVSELKYTGKTTFGKEKVEHIETTLTEDSFTKKETYNILLQLIHIDKGECDDTLDQECFLSKDLIDDTEEGV